MALIDKASLLMVPSTYEAGKLYNVLPSGNRAPDSTDQNSGYDQTRADFDFSRGSNLAATRINSDGLIEKGRENLLLQSNSFDTTPWAAVNGTLTSGQSGYDGSNNAWLFLRTSAGGSVRQSVALSGVQTTSIYAKSGSLNWVAFVGGGSLTAYFDLENGILGTVSGAKIDAKIESVGNGWYRCSLTQDLSITEIRVYPALGDSDLSADGSILIQNAQLEQGLVATTYLNSGATTAKSGVLIDMPRINYDANGNNGALLLEPSRQQLLPFSEYFGGWTLISNGTGIDPVLDFGYISPEGLNNAYKITLDSGAGTATSDESILYLNKSGVTAGSEHTASVYLKGAVGGEEVIVRDTAGSYKKWTLTTEWARYEYTQTATATSYATSFGLRQGLGGIGTINSSAVVYIYGFQSELGSYKTSLIPNHGTSGGVTRAADSCSVTGASDVIGQTEGTVFCEWDYQNIGSSGGNIPISLNGASGQELYFWVKPDGTYVYDVYSSGQQASISGSIGSFGIKKIALAYKNNDFALFINGVLIGSDTSGSVPTLTNIFVGRYAINTNYNISSGINQASLFPTALTDAECIALTTL
jgi:hypothetical protein